LIPDEIKNQGFIKNIVKNKDLNFGDLYFGDHRAF
jgi:hypothetical protein